EGGELALSGWWQVEAIIRRRGRMDASAAFPLYLGPTAPGSNDPAAEALLRRAREATGHLKSWREAEALTDGNGGFVFARYELMPPDRLRYRTGGRAPQGGTAATTEAIIIGATRYLRQGEGPWERDTLPSPIVVEGPALYLRDAEGARRSRREACDGEECQIVLWRGPGGSPHYAGWIGVRTFRVHRLLMAAPAHYMTLRAFDFNRVSQIAPPE
ncbi:MAG: hypothetical protein HY334_01685, partial [Armatimonadetes bacterium]|nr:hypothetical protein [Armatimonadota bacterium]